MSLEAKSEAKVLAWFGAVTDAAQQGMRIGGIEDLVRKEEVDTIVELALGLVPDRSKVEAELGPERIKKL